MVVFCVENTQTAAANGDTRTISLHHIHTNEDLTITYKRNGHYDAEAMKKIDWLMRDWRKNESVKMDPQAIDILWTVQQDIGKGRPIWIVCGYRAPGTNAMLRRRSSGVAEFSQHTLGKAIDFYIPGANLEETREIGLKLQRGGVGYYPTSGSPFVHMDVGSVRHWPRMSHDQLARVFPDGRTVHIPSDGKPLKGYALALADIENRGGSMPSQISLASARNSGVDTGVKPKRSLLASIFNTKDDDDGDAAAVATNAPAINPAANSAPARATTKREAPRVVASAEPVATPPAPVRNAAADPVPGSSEQIKPVKVAPVRVAAIPMPPARPARAVQVAQAMPRAIASKATTVVGKNAVTVVASNDIFANRGAWGDDGLKQVNQTEARGQIDARGTWGDDGLKQIGDLASYKIASSYQVALADTSASIPVSATPISAPIGYAGVLTHKPRSPADIAASPVEMIRPVQVASRLSFDDIWMKALVIAPNLHHFMSATLMGTPDPKELRPLMRKPTSALAMNFSSDPQNGMTTSSFSGEAVVFLDKVSFVTRTAMLAE